MKKTILIISGILLSILSQGQTWEKRYDFNGNALGADEFEEVNGDWYVIGVQGDYSVDWNTIEIIDGLNGALKQTLTFPLGTSLFDIENINDSLVVVVGSDSSNFYIGVYDLNLNLVWEDSIVPDSNHFLLAGVETDGENIYAVGGSYNSTVYSGAMLFCWDISGNLVWEDSINQFNLKFESDIKLFDDTLYLLEQQYSSPVYTSILHRLTLDGNYIGSDSIYEGILNEVVKVNGQYYFTGGNIALINIDTVWGLVVKMNNKFEISWESRFKGNDTINNQVWDADFNLGYDIEVENNKIIVCGVVDGGMNNPYGETFYGILDIQK